MSEIDERLISIWAVYQTMDEYGRLGKLTGVYRTEEDAYVGALGQGWYGSPGRVFSKMAIEDGDKLYVLEDSKPWQFSDVTELKEKRRQERLEGIIAKLSPDEVELLKEAFA